MLKSYWIVAWRNLLRNRIFSVINITGLAIGLTVSFLIYQYVNVELSYDQFHKNADRIYRVPISYKGSFSSQPPSASNHPAVGPALKADFPEVEDFARLVRASLFINAATVAYEKDASVISYLLALPFVYLAIESWLNNFAFHIQMEWQMYLLPPLFLLAISVATITFICLRAALRSPTISLRLE